ncbi:hypothetical protein GCM10009630_01100 [Kribbella jejuensis]
MIPDRGPNGAGGNDIEADAEFAVPGGVVDRHRDLAGLGGGVLDVAEGSESVDRADRDDVAAVLHQLRERGLDTARGADQGQVELRVELLGGRVLGGRPDDAATGVVDQDVQAAEPLGRGRDRRVHVGAVRHVDA